MIPSRRGGAGLMNIYIGNLSRKITEAELREQFEPFGKVVAVNLVKDRRSGVPRGFGYVEMESPEEGQAAIEGLKGQILDGRMMDVTESSPPGKGKKGGFKGGGKKRRRF